MPEIKVKKFSRSNIESHLNAKQAEVVQEPAQEVIVEPNNLNEKFEEMPEMPEMQDLFEDLNNENFVFESDVKKTKSEKEQIKLERERLKLDVARKKEEERSIKELQKINNKKPTKATAKKSGDEDELFSSTPTELLGLDKRQLLAKLNQYKALFPKQLKTFKIKKNPTMEDLQNAIAECDAIVQTDSVEGFMTDSILQCITMIEGVSARTRYNVSGMAEMLRDNKQFHELCKVLYIKHQVFGNVPPEYQMMMLVATTAMIAKSKNDKKSSLDAILSKQIDPALLA
jgi:hypothetical protein